MFVQPLRRTQPWSPTKLKTLSFERPWERYSRGGRDLAEALQRDLDLIQTQAAERLDQLYV